MNQERWFSTRLKISLKNGKNILGWSTKHKNQKNEFLQKTRTFDLEIQKIKQNKKTRPMLPT